MTRLSPARVLPLGVLILAAGRSARMGQPKLLLPWGRTSVLGHLIEQWRALGAKQIAVVRAADNRALQAEMDRVGFPARDRITNAAPERGMFSSIQCAARWPGWLQGLTHFAVVLGDQPHLRRQTLRQLLDFGAAHPSKVCQPARRGHRRHPVLMPKRVFCQLADSRAKTFKRFLASRFRQVAICELDDPGLDLDIDRPADYKRAILLGGRQTRFKPG